MLWWEKSNVEHIVCACSRSLLWDVSLALHLMKNNNNFMFTKVKLFLQHGHNDQQQQSSSFLSFLPSVFLAVMNFDVNGIIGGFSLFWMKIKILGMVAEQTITISLTTLRLIEIVAEWLSQQILLPYLLQFSCEMKLFGKENWRFAAVGGPITFHKRL